MAGARYQYKNISLYFGMVATQIVSERYMSDVSKEIKTTNVKAFACIIYGGMCNAAEIADSVWPSFEEAYLLTEEILEDEEQIQNDIYTLWAESKPGKKLLESLPKPVTGVKKKETPKARKKIGTK